jgi:protein-tyrosine kinase
VPRRDKPVRAFAEPGRDTEAYRTLRLAVEARLGTGSNSVLFTSPRRGDGRSTTSVNVAVAAAMRQTSVVLVDADFQNPTLHRIFGVPQAPGLTDALRDGLDASEVAHSFWRHGPLSVVTAGTELPRAADLAGSPAMADFLRRAAEGYDLVAIDSPPALLAADASELALHAGVGVVLVIRPTARRREVAGTLRKLAMTEARVLGMVVNRQKAAGSLARS